MSRFVPGWSLVGQVVASSGAIMGGNKFETAFKNEIRQLFGSFNLQQVFFSVGVDSGGDATGAWLIGSSTEDEPYTLGASRPDFVLTPPGAKPRSSKKITDKENRSYLIGDFKLSLKTAYNTYVGSKRYPAKTQGIAQFNAMAKYANKNAYKFVGIIALFGEGDRRRFYEAQLAKKAITSGKVGLLMVSILEDQKSPFKTP